MSHRQEITAERANKLLSGSAGRDANTLSMASPNSSITAASPTKPSLDWESRVMSPQLMPVKKDWGFFLRNKGVVEWHQRLDIISPYLKASDQLDRSGFTLYTPCAH